MKSYSLFYECYSNKDGISSEGNLGAIVFFFFVLRRISLPVNLIAQYTLIATITNIITLINIIVSYIYCNHLKG